MVVLVILFGLFENQPPSTSLGTDVSFVLVTLLSGMSRVSIRDASDQQKVDGNKPVKQKYTMESHKSFILPMEKPGKTNKKSVPPFLSLMPKSDRLSSPQRVSFSSAVASCLVPPIDWRKSMQPGFFRGKIHQPPAMLRVVGIFPHKNLVFKMGDSDAYEKSLPATTPNYPPKK